MSELRNAILALQEEKRMSLEQIKKTIEDSLIAAYKKKFDTDVNAEVHFEDDLSAVTLYARKQVVDEAEDALDRATEISLVKAKELDPNAEEGDVMLISVDLGLFDRGSVQSGKQRAQQSMRDIQKSDIFSELKKKEGQMVTGIVQSERNGDYFVDLGRSQGYLPKSEQSLRDSYSKGDKIKCILKSVTCEDKDPNPRVLLSRASEKLVERLFEQYIPELNPSNPSIVIYKVVREVGYRCKVAVYSNRPEMDPVGTCVGLAGQRIKSIQTELSGEQIDVLKFDAEPVEFIANALSPVQVQQVYVIDPNTKKAIAIVADNQLSLAIGKGGNNVKLANRLVDWNVDVKTQSQFAELDISKSIREAADQLFNPSEEEQYEDELQDEVKGEEGELMLNELPISKHVIEVLNYYDVYSLQEYLDLVEDDFANMPKLTSEAKAELDKIIEENVSFVDEGGDELAYQCPNCGAAITNDMTECPNCHTQFSFE